MATGKYIPAPFKILSLHGDCAIKATGTVFGRFVKNDCFFT
jgi:hypothetical protein